MPIFLIINVGRYLIVLKLKHPVYPAYDYYINASIPLKIISFHNKYSVIFFNKKNNNSPYLFSVGKLLGTTKSWALHYESVTSRPSD